jgi:hypothetical protein
MSADDRRQTAEIAHTCDSCAEGPKHCQTIGDAYVCDDCIAFHERAVDAATEAVTRDYALFGSLYGAAIPLSDDLIREIVALGVKAYCEFTDEAHNGREQER